MNFARITTKGRHDYRMTPKWTFSQRRRRDAILTPQMAVSNIFLTVAII